MNCDVILSAYYYTFGGTMLGGKLQNKKIPLYLVRCKFLNILKHCGLDLNRVRTLMD